MAAPEPEEAEAPEPPKKRGKAKAPPKRRGAVKLDKAALEARMAADGWTKEEKQREALHGRGVLL